jgi:hypothetical protein
VHFGLLGLDGGNDAAIGDFAARGNFFFGDKINCSCSFDVAGWNTLSETAKLVDKGFFPNSFVGALDEMTVFLDLASDGIGHCVGLLLGVHWGKKLLGNVVDVVRLLLRPCGVAMADWVIGVG